LSSDRRPRRTLSGAHQLDRRLAELDKASAKLAAERAKLQHQRDELELAEYEARIRHMLNLTKRFKSKLDRIDPKLGAELARVIAAHADVTKGLLEA
jgi:hypothetical protein